MYYFFNSDTIFFYIPSKEQNFIEIYKGKSEEISEIINILRQLDLMDFPNLEVKEGNPRNIHSDVLTKIKENNIISYNNKYIWQPNYLIKLIKTITHLLEK